MLCGAVHAPSPTRRLESCNIVLNLLENHRLDLHFDRLLKSSHQQEVSGCPHSTCDVSLIELNVRFRPFALKAHAPRATGRVSVGIQRLKRYLAEDRGLIQIRFFTILLFALMVMLPSSTIK